jgi:hypothetical protein
MTLITVSILPTVSASRTDIPPEWIKEVQDALARLKQASDRATGLARLVVTSSEFRQLLQEGWELVKDMWVHELWQGRWRTAN